MKEPTIAELKKELKETIDKNNAIARDMTKMILKKMTDENYIDLYYVEKNIHSGSYAIAYQSVLDFLNGKTNNL